MPLSTTEKVVDSWFDKHYAHSFSSFLRSLNDTEAGIVREILLGRDNSASSGQFSDATQDESLPETSNVSATSAPIQTDGSKEKKSVTQVFKASQERDEIETNSLVKSPVSKVNNS